MTDHETGHDVAIRALCVDDEPTTLGLMSRLLERMDMDVSTANGPLAALEMFEPERFDLIVTDIRMPGMDGHAFLAEIRARDPNVPVIVATGHASLDNAIRALRDGASGMLIKPFTVTELTAEVTNALQRARTRSEAIQYRFVTPILDGVALALTAAIEARDLETGAHCQELGTFGERVARLLGLSEQEWTSALNGRRGALFSLPATEGLPIEFPAIDSAIAFPVSKAALAHERTRTLNTPLDPAGRALLSNWLMRRVGRHAFPDELEAHVLAPLRDKVAKAMGKNSQSGFLASSLLGIWSSTEWAPSASILFVVDHNRLTALGVDVDLDKAVNELLGPVRKALGKANIAVQVTGTVRTLDAVSAFELMVAHREVDLDVLPIGELRRT